MKEKEGTTHFFENLIQKLDDSATFHCDHVRGCESVRQKAYRAANLNRDCGHKFASSIDYDEKAITITTVLR